MYSWGRDEIGSASRWPWIMQRKPAPLGLREFELADYQRLPDVENLSPGDLLHGETHKTELISDLDGFFGRLYSYYVEKGFWCIVIQWIVQLLTLGFIICFSGFFLLFVDWQRLKTIKCGVDALEERTKPCDLVQEALIRHPLTHLTFFKAVVVLYLVLFSLYWIFCFLRFFIQLKETLEIRKFYFNSLGITDRELQTTPWPTLLEKIVDYQREQRLCVVRELSPHDIVMRIMRKDNYLIGMLNKGILAVPIPSWVPGVGPVVYRDNYGVGRRLFLSKTFEWSLNWCILQNMFDRNFRIRGELLNNSVWLRRRFMVVGIAILLLSPVFIIFMFVYFFLRYAEEFYHHPSSIVSRRWSNLATWIFREFNELDHLFKWRINNSYKYAVEYVKQFPSPILSLVAKLVSFITGGFAAVLLIIAFLDESLLEAHLFGRNLLWFVAVFGTITAISRAAIPEEFQVFEPEKSLRVVACYTHHMPKHWRRAENRDVVRSEFEGLFQYTGMALLEELVSIFVTPYILIFLLPKQIEELQDFLRDFSENVEGVGHVCRVSQFNFKSHGNSKYGSPFTTSKVQRSCQGKMEKSFLSFKLNYRNWEPDSSGKQLLATLADFYNSNLQLTKPLNILPGFPRFKYNGSSSMIHPIFERPWTVSHSQITQKCTHPDQVSQSFDCNFMLEAGLDQEFLFCLLDRYYNSKSPEGCSSLATRLDQATTSLDQISGLVELRSRKKLFPPSEVVRQSDEQSRKGLGFGKTEMDMVWVSSSKTEKGSSSHDVEDGGSPLPVSRHFGEGQWWARARPAQSSSALNDSFLEPPMFGGAPLPVSRHFGEGPWWARARPAQSSSALNDSFLEPPMFGGAHLVDSNLYDSSAESEEEQSKAWESGQPSQGVHTSSVFKETVSGFELPFGDLNMETDSQHIRLPGRENRQL